METKSTDPIQETIYQTSILIIYHSHGLLRKQTLVSLHQYDTYIHSKMYLKAYQSIYLVLPDRN